MKIDFIYNCIKNRFYDIEKLIFSKHALGLKNTKILASEKRSSTLSCMGYTVIYLRA